MKPYKMVAFDIDGTLVDDQKVLTEKTLELLENLHKSKIEVCISTGRPFVGCRMILNKLSFKPSVIAYNGGSIYLKDDYVLLNERFLSFDSVKEILFLSEQFQVSAMIWVSDTLFVLRENKWVDEYKKISLVSPVVMDSLDVLKDLKVNKILLYSSLEKISLVKSRLTSGAYDYFSSKKDFLEIVPKDVNKGEALKVLSKELGVLKEEIIAIGDGDNDISMIDYAGLGIAMNNASEGLKAVADVVVPFTNNEDLLKKYLENLLKILQ